MRLVRVATALVCLAAVPLASAACGSREEVAVDRRGDGALPAAAPSGAAAALAARTPRIVILGDSLTAGLGLPPEEAYPALIQQRLTERGLPYEVVNAGVSGDTSAGGLSRLDWALEGNVKVLVVALGANDGLRGLPIDQLERNLTQIIERAQQRGIEVVIAGMEAPPNFGARYTAAFRDVYPQLAKKYRLALVPFLLEGVAAVDALNRPDGLHPNRQGAVLVSDHVWSVLEPTLEGRAIRD